MSDIELEDDDNSTLGEFSRWNREIDYYENKSSSWERKAKRIIRRYKDMRSVRDSAPARFNALWSIVQTTMPALYARLPKPDIERRWRDRDPLGRSVSTILERSISYFIGSQFNCSVKQAILDLLLAGRGTVWVRYEPHFKDSSLSDNEEIADDGLQLSDDSDDDTDSPQLVEVLTDEQIEWDYVHWQDFGHTYGRTWDEVDGIWRKTYQKRAELIERFGEEIGKQIPLDYTPTDIKDSKEDDGEKKATIYEIWCKSERKVYWIHKDYKLGCLDIKDDPLELRDFWPTPMPLFATLGNDDCIPVPDYLLYQDQAQELDELTGRIHQITKAVKVAGVYDSSAQGIERVLAEGIQNKLIPVDQWAMFAEKGGMKGAMELLPMGEIVGTLTSLYDARDRVKQDLYEITGISDIVRGASDPNETYGAQRIKARFGNLRLSTRQDMIESYCRDLVSIGAQIISKHFSIETIQRICDVKLFTLAEKEQLKLSQNNPNIPLPPIANGLDAEDVAELMDAPTWEEVESVIRSNKLLAYKVDIETDSTKQLDDDVERDARVQFLQAVGQFLREALTAPPSIAPFLAKSLMFMMRGFKVGKELEGTAEEMIKQLEQQAANPPQQQPSPEMMKIQGELQLAQLKIQNDKETQILQANIDKQRADADAQSEIARLQAQAQVDANQSQWDMRLSMIESQNKAALEQQKMQIELSLKEVEMRYQAKIALMEAEIKAQSQLQASQIQAAKVGASDDDIEYYDEGGNRL